MPGILLRLVSHNDHAARALGGHFTGDLRCGLAAVERLAAGHGNGIVEEDLVRHIDARCDGGTDRQRARMHIGAVADVLEHMLGLGERRLTRPIGALAAHLRKA